MSKTLRDKMKHCSGCYSERYNHPGMCERPGIDAPVTSRNCWSLPEAKLVTRYAIGTWTMPASKGAFSKVTVLDCYHQNGTSYCKNLPDFVKAEDVR